MPKYEEPPDIDFSFKKKKKDTNILESVYEMYMNAPEFVTKKAKEFSDWVTTPKKVSEDTKTKIPVGKDLFVTPQQNDIELAKAKGFLGGATEGAASQASPANAVSAALSIGPVAKAIGPIANYVNKGVGAAQVLHGGKKVYEGNTAEGLGEMGFGALGMLPHPNPKKVVIPPVEAPLPKERLALPPGRYIAGPSGEGGISASASIPLEEQAALAGLKTGGLPGEPQASPVDLDVLKEQQRLQGLDYTQASQYPGESVDVHTVGPYEPGSLPRQAGDTAGGFAPESAGGLPYPLDVVPERLRPRSAQTSQLRKLPEDVNVEPHVSEPQDITFENQPIPDIEPLVDKSPTYLGEGHARPGEPQTPSAVKQKVEPLIPPPANVDSIPVAEARTPKQAIQNWAWGRDSAKERGRIARDEFADLSDPTYIDQYQTGNRQGPLAKVQTYLDDLFSKEKKAGLLKDDAYKDNYLRQYWDMDASSPESIAAFNRSRIARTPGFAKESTFDTYQAGKNAGLVPKFSTIPEIIEARTAEHYKALKNKELYDWLSSTGQIKKGGVVQSPDTWNLIGPNRDDLQKLITNYLSNEKPYKGGADIVSATKNIYLGGGIPGTKYNMHAWNIARADAKLNGFISAGKKFFSDPTGNKALDWLNNMPKEERALIPELIEHGFTTRPIEDMGKDLTVFSNMAKSENKFASTVGKFGDVALDKVQHVFEAPLFERALPALKMQRTLEAFHALEPELGRSKALSAAAKIGNEFYGGVNKAIRNKTKVDTSRILLLAPDWLESRLRLAVSEWKGTGKTLLGQGDAVDKIYAKSFGRGLATTAVGYAAGGKLLDQTRNRSINAIPMGDVDEFTHREFPTMTSADEGQRLPLQAPINMYEGNPLALKDILIKNRISTPASAFIDIVRGQDTFGNPLSGKDKYGKPISGMQSIKNYALEASRPFQHQAIQGLIGWLNGSLSAEEAIAMGAEIPISYNKDRPSKKKSTGNINIRVP